VFYAEVTLPEGRTLKTPGWSGLRPCLSFLDITMTLADWSLPSMDWTSSGSEWPALVMNGLPLWVKGITAKHGGQGTSVQGESVFRDLPVNVGDLPPPAARHPREERVEKVYDPLGANISTTGTRVVNDAVIEVQFDSVYQTAQAVRTIRWPQPISANVTVKRAQTLTCPFGPMQTTISCNLAFDYDLHPDAMDVSCIFVTEGGLTATASGGISMRSQMHAAVLIGESSDTEWVVEIDPSTPSIVTKAFIFDPGEAVAGRCE
jgi:hypothetical protein